MAPSRPQLGRFCTATNRVWSDPDADDVVTTEPFANPFSSAPDMITALNFIDIIPTYLGSAHTIGIKSSAEDVRGHQFTLRIGVWGDGNMADNGCNWLALSPGDTRYRCGTSRVDRRTMADGMVSDVNRVPSGRVMESGSESDLEPQQEPEPEPVERYAQFATLPVLFDTPFPGDTSPTVVVWLSGFQMATDDLWHLGVDASEVTHAGFRIEVSAPRASLYQASIAWFAYVPGTAQSGWFATAGVNVEKADYGTSLRKEGQVEFDTPFGGVPRVMLGVCRVEIAESPCVTVQVHDPMNVDARGFKWKVGGWGNTVCENVAVAYIALGDP